MSNNCTLHFTKIAQEIHRYYMGVAQDSFVLWTQKMPRKYFLCKVCLIGQRFKYLKAALRLGLDKPQSHIIWIMQSDFRNCSIMIVMVWAVRSDRSLFSLVICFIAQQLGHSTHYANLIIGKWSLIGSIEWLCPDVPKNDDNNGKINSALQFVFLVIF